MRNVMIKYFDSIRIWNFNLVCVRKKVVNRKRHEFIEAFKISFAILCTAVHSSVKACYTVLLNSFLCRTSQKYCK